MSYVASMEAWL